MMQKLILAFGLERIVREWFKTNPLSQKEYDMLIQIQRRITDSKCCINPPPDELRLVENQRTPQHRVTADDLLPNVWNTRLKLGLLTSDVQDMIADITAYLRSRGEANIGNANDPWALTCYELLWWMARDLSGVTCDEQAETMIKCRISYINKLIADDIFETAKEESEKKLKSTMLQVLTATRIRLERIKKFIVDLEIANSSVREHLYKLNIEGTKILNYGFQFLCFILRDTNKINKILTADIFQLPVEILETRTGQLLKCLIDSPIYLEFFGVNFNIPEQNDTPAENEESFVVDNPFYNENQLCIPLSIIKDLKKSKQIHSFLTGKYSSKDSGILKSFNENKDLLTTFLDMHAILIEIAYAIFACNVGHKSAGVGGELLVYTKSHDVMTALMETLTNLFQEFSRCHSKLRFATGKMEDQLSTKTGIFLSSDEQAWLQFLTGEIPSISTQLDQAFSSSATFIKKILMSSNNISPQERYTMAKKQTEYFADTARIISDHVNSVLSKQPLQIEHDNTSPPAPRSPHQNGPRFLSPRSSGAGNVGALPDISETGQLIQSESEVSQPELMKLDYRRTPQKEINDNNCRFTVGLITRNKHNLGVVILKNNSLTTSSTKILWDTLAECPLLREVDVQYNLNLLTYDPRLINSQESLNAFSTFLALSPSLSILNIKSCGLDSHSAKIIGDGLRKNRTLTILDIGSNTLGNEGIKEICLALHDHPKLHDLRLTFIDITDEGAQYIFELLDKNKNITDLHMDEGRSVSDEMILKISRLLYERAQAADPSFNATSMSQSFN